MNKMPSKNAEDLNDELLPEYKIDYSQTRPNRFADRMGTEKLKVVVLDDDVAQVFTTPEAVNEALRALIASNEATDNRAKNKVTVAGRPKQVQVSRSVSTIEESDHI